MYMRKKVQKRITYIHTLNSIGLFFWIIKCFFFRNLTCGMIYRSNFFFWKNCFSSYFTLLLMYTACLLIMLMLLMIMLLVLWCGFCCCSQWRSSWVCCWWSGWWWLLLWRWMKVMMVTMNKNVWLLFWLNWWIFRSF